MTVCKMALSLRLWRLEKLWFHVNLAEFGNAATQLKQRLHPVQDAHMREANLFDEFQLGVFRERRDRFGHSEHSANDIVGRVSQGPVDTVRTCGFPPDGQ